MPLGVLDDLDSRPRDSHIGGEQDFPRENQSERAVVQVFSVATGERAVRTVSKVRPPLCHISVQYPQRLIYSPVSVFDLVGPRKRLRLY